LFISLPHFHLSSKYFIAAIIAKTAGEPALREIHELAVMRTSDLQAALKHPGKL